MKKMFTLSMAVCMVVMLLAGCTAESETIRSIKEEKVIEEETQVIYGDYFIFRTKNAQAYLNFLETFDETKYEIVDISTSIFVTDASAEFYIVTYRVKHFETE